MRLRQFLPSAAGVVLIALRAVAGVLVLVTALSVVESNEWWIRIWDFPRAQILALLILVGALALWQDRRWGRLVALFCAVASGWQVYRILPYTWLAQKEVAFADGTAGAARDCFSVLSLNVHQSNQDWRATTQLIAREQPDVLLLMETGPRWTAALAPVLQRYPHRVVVPLDNTYGMILATRLNVRQARVETIVRKDTPSIHAELVAGRPFRLLALHPRPPVSGRDTDARDAEIAIAARRVARTDLPVLAIGDFNDVAWSHTSQLFKRIGGYLDPRIGRGTYATFPAGYPLIGWPLDQLFVTPEFAVRSMEVLSGVGSDHLPVKAEICLAKRGEKRGKPDRPTAEDRSDVREIIEDGPGRRPS